jgi:rfaE bifunctional protein kinase chain/domain
MEEFPFQRISIERLRHLLANMREGRIAVIGDFCLDVYWHLDMQASETSVETGKMTQPVREQRYLLGGAGNVTANLHDLGIGQVHTFGVVGNDPFGQTMLALLRQYSDCSHILRSDSDSWQTLTYCKPYVDEEEMARIDMGNFNKLSNSLAQDLVDKLDHHVEDFDIIIINEQVASGIHTPFLQNRLVQLMQKHKESIFIFDGRHLRNVYNHAWMKINDLEAMRLSGQNSQLFDLIPLSKLKAALAHVALNSDRPLIVTRGAHGCIVCSQKGMTAIPGIQVQGKVDTVGAGDTFLAGLAAALSAGAKLGEAAQVANMAAAVTIRKIGQCGTSSPDELLDVASTVVYKNEIE